MKVFSAVAYIELLWCRSFQQNNDNKCETAAVNEHFYKLAGISPEEKNGFFFKMSFNVDMSCQPGRNTRTAPS